MSNHINNRSGYWWHIKNYCLIDKSVTRKFPYFNDFSDINNCHNSI